MDRKILIVSFSFILCVYTISCSVIVIPDPFAPSEDAQVKNLWPAYKRVVDESKEFSETQIAWPFYKTRRIPDGKMTRLWPLYYGYKTADAEGKYIFPLTLFLGSTGSTLPPKKQRVSHQPIWIH